MTCPLKMADSEFLDISDFEHRFLTEEADRPAVNSFDVSTLVMRLQEVAWRAMEIYEEHPVFSVVEALIITMILWKVTRWIIIFRFRVKEKILSNNGYYSIKTLFS